MFLLDHHQDLLKNYGYGMKLLLPLLEYMSVVVSYNRHKINIISYKDLMDVPPEVNAEPVQALYGGPDGMSAHRALIERAHKILRKGGFLILEIRGDATHIKNQKSASMLRISDS